MQDHISRDHDRAYAITRQLNHLGAYADQRVFRVAHMDAGHVLLNLAAPAAERLCRLFQ